jgi:hypothetical protein
MRLSGSTNDSKHFVHGKAPQFGLSDFWQNDSVEWVKRNIAPISNFAHPGKMTPHQLFPAQHADLTTSDHSRFSAHDCVRAAAGVVRAAVERGVNGEHARRLSQP